MKSNEDFLNIDNINNDIIYHNNNITKDSQEVNNILNNLTNLNSMQSSIKDSKYNFNNLTLNKNTKTYESDENVVIGNMSMNTTLKNNSICNSKNNNVSGNVNFNGTGKTKFR